MEYHDLKLSGIMHPYPKGGYGAMMNSCAICGIIIPEHDKQMFRLDPEQAAADFTRRGVDKKRWPRRRNAK